ncbi:uncharacterized protein LOC134280137 [Saccostrea cucullata]|uniref:uncharacterized protein LOC134280137 n=1 Tax=Saccostrea cuccullata TaxID=36930 RepID=UPI002ED1508D
MQSVPLLVTLGANTPTLEYLVLGCIGLTLLIGVVMIFFTPVEKVEEITPLDGNLGSSSESVHSRHNKVAPAPMTYEEVIQERRRYVSVFCIVANLDFESASFLSDDRENRRESPRGYRRCVF